MSSISDRNIAAVCKRGHVISSDANPEVESKRRCGECGAQVLIARLSCQAPILGTWREAVVIGIRWKPDEFCWHCGIPYPWASRESIAYHIENLLDEQKDLAPGDRRVLEERLGALREPPTQGDVERRQIQALESLKKLAPKAWELAQPLITTIATAEIKLRLGLPP